MNEWMNDHNVPQFSEYGTIPHFLVQKKQNHYLYWQWIFGLSDNHKTLLAQIYAVGKNLTTNLLHLSL